MIWLVPNGLDTDDNTNACIYYHFDSFIFSADGIVSLVLLKTKYNSFLYDRRWIVSCKIYVSVIKMMNYLFTD